ncbi:entericidin A/B family lipoprotein [Candidatus Tisiphia endosymbiont of Beris chalybata]|uniref:entericidin A/B family lipoprotein n=1 Tax=Candidatus Tisiphia endosymbiont of Beris chalybata TaxID=3066262 RepID=UPI003977AD27
MFKFYIKGTLMHLSFMTMLLLTTMLSSCNTMQGMGKDLQAGGKKLEHSAETHKPAK